jgi:hypothetical protein
MSINYNKYTPYIFGNGRVVLVENKTIDEAIGYGKEILIICNAWSGGYAHAIGAEKDIDPDFGECWNMYGYDIKDKELDATDLDKFWRVIVSSGEQIWMKSGDQANSYIGGVFTDWNTSLRSMCDRTGVTVTTEDEAYKRRTTVDACGTVRRLNYKYTEDHKPDYADWEERIWALIRIGILPKDAVKYLNKRD